MERSMWAACTAKLLAFVMIASSFFFLLTIIPMNARASILYVGGIGFGNYTTIQEAVDAANPGDTIFVYNGSYSEHVVINKSVSLVGENQSTTIVYGEAINHVITITANWVNVTDFTILGNGTETNQAGIWIDSNQNISIVKNILSNSNTGIFLNGSMFCSLVNNSIYGNNYGVRLSFSSRNLVINNTISTNNFSGIHLINSNNNLIQNNQITNKTQFTQDIGAIHLQLSAFNTIVNNTVTRNVGKGIHLFQSQFNSAMNNSMEEDGFIITGNLLEDWNTHTIDVSNTVNGQSVQYWKNATGGSIPPDAGQVIIVNSSGVTVVNQNLSDSDIGLTLSFSSNCIINNITSLNNQIGIALYLSDNNSLTNMTVANDYYGVSLSTSHDNTLSRIVADDNEYGISITYSDGNIVLNGTFVINHIAGVYLSSSQNTTISGNTLQSNYQSGIYVGVSQNVTLKNNNVSGGMMGISVRNSLMFIINNTLSNNDNGIIIGSSTNNFIANNNLIGDGIFIDGYTLEHWNTHTIETTNTVNLKPIYYLKNVSNWIVPSGAGEVILANSTDITIKNQNVSDGDIGILVGFSSGNNITNVTTNNNSYGIYVTNSNSNIFNFNVLHNDQNAIFARNSYYNLLANGSIENSTKGILLSDSDNTYVQNNTISGNVWGIDISSSNNITITNNTISSNIWGITFTDSIDDSIYHNNFIGNTWHASPEAGSSWDNRYPSGGNYWSDYTGIDIYSGINQDEPLSDGIGDTPYIIFGSSERDMYPLMHRSGSPSPPQNLQAFRGNTSATLTWTPPVFQGSFNVTNYSIYRGLISGGETFLVELGNILNYVDTGLTNGQQYFYRVSARNLIGEGPLSNEVNVTPATVPEPPIGLIATPGNQQISLMWSPPSNDGGIPIINYTIYRGMVSGGETFLVSIGNVTNYLDAGLTNGQTYYYQVSALNAIGEGPRSIETSATPATYPSAPLNLQASAGNTQVTLSWLAPISDGGSPITNYRIYRGTISGGETFLTMIGNVLTHVDVGLTNGQTYFYKVSAVNNVGESPQSNEASATPATTPTEPLNLQATEGNNQITLTWLSPSDNGGSPITNYNIYRGLTSGGETFLIQVGNVLTYLDTAVTNGITYYYKVAALNVMGKGPNSTEVFATPATKPSSPLNLQATAGDGQVTLIWTAPSYDGGSPITNYTIYRGLTSGGETLLTVIGNVLTYTDTGLTNGQIYYYKVSATNAKGEGPKSSGASAIPATNPSEPLNLQATFGNREVILTWNSPNDDGGMPITNYRIYRGLTSGSEVFLIEIGNVLTYTDTGLTNGQTYYYRISAKNVRGESQQSNEAFATPATIPSSPISLHATAGDGQVTLTWTAPQSDGGMPITNYRVYKGERPGWESLLIEIGNVFTYTDTNVVNGQLYYYEVTAKNTVGESLKSNEAGAIPATPPGQPTDTAAVAGNQQVVLTWTAPTSDGGVAITNYRIYRGTSAGGESFLIEVGNILTYTDSDVINGQTYYYTVSAKNRMGEGPQSAEVSATPSIIPPNQLPTCTITAPSSGDTISGIYTITGTASDPDGTVEYVEVKVDYGYWIRAVGNNAWSVDLNTVKLIEGAHTIYARAFDGSNYSSLASMSVTVVREAIPPSEGPPITQNAWFWVMIEIVILLLIILVEYLLKKRHMKTVVEEFDESSEEIEEKMKEEEAEEIE